MNMPVETKASAPGPTQEDGAEKSEKPVRRRKGGPRERSGCVTCRNRKKKCDGGFPICEQCRRLNYTCLREEPRSAIPKNAHTWKTPPKVLTQSNEDSTPNDASVVSRGQDASGNIIDPATSIELSKHRKEVMRYYIQVFSRMLTTNHENNCFLSVFLPMAMDSPTLQNAILAWSCSHLSLQDEKYKRTALQFRGASLSTLSTALSSQVGGQPDYESSLASCLVLCSMEIILGDIFQWYKHLAGAFEVIRSTMDVGQDKSPLVPTGFLATSDGQWLLRNFAYHDILASVTCGRRPFLSGYYWANEDESIPDSYFGLASGLMYLISEISVLNSDMAELPSFVNIHDIQAPQKLDPSLVAPFFDGEYYIPKTPGQTTAGFSLRARQLESELLSWQCSSSKESSLVALAETYRAAALIHLYRILRQHLPDLTPTLEYKISQVVQTMMECLETMPAGCLPECTLLFPLFMAGGEARNLDDVRVIRKRLVDVLETRYFRNVKVALEVLDEVWRGRAGLVNIGMGAAGEDAPCGTDWQEVLRRKGWKLALT